MWGKVLGVLFGFMLLKIPGGIIGLIIGHMFDKGYAQSFTQQGGFSGLFDKNTDFQRQAIFFHSLFSALGHLAKSDGRVTSSEIKIAAALMERMQLEGNLKKEAQQAFREGKERDFPLIEMLKDFKQSCSNRRDVLQIYLEILIQAAFADGKMSPEEFKVLEVVAKSLGFSRLDLEFLVRTFQAETRFRQGYNNQHAHNRSQHGSGASNSYSSASALKDAYGILGASENDTDKEVKRAYRKLMSEHHPDKLVSKGLPAQALEMAKNKAQDIQAAYELIKEKRDIK